MTNLFSDVSVRSGKLCMVVSLVISFFIIVMTDSAFAEQDDSSSAAREAENVSAIYDTLAAGNKIETNRKFVVPEQPTVYLTFDDGPSTLTPTVLDILQEEGVLATFFVLGEMAEQQPETIKRMVEEGHAIGNHTYNHQYKELYKGYSSFIEQINQTEIVLDQMAGVKPVLVRAPGGTYTNFDPFYFYLLEQAGYVVHDWNIDSQDAIRSGVPAQEIATQVKAGPFQHELIVLLHDGYGHKETVKALRDIIHFFKEKGYAFAPLTTDVKPKQFSIAKSRWNRELTLDAFSKYVDDARMAAQARQPEVKVEEKTYPLSLKVDGSELTLDANRNRFENGRFYVPVRDVVDAMGGTVSWDEATFSATARHGTYSVTYDIRKKQLVSRDGRGQEKVLSLAEMELIDGKLWVPLRQVVELLGHTIVDYSTEQSNRFVGIKLTKQSIPSAWLPRGLQWMFLYLRMIDFPQFFPFV